MGRKPAAYFSADGATEKPAQVPPEGTGADLYRVQSKISHTKAIVFLFLICLILALSGCARQVKTGEMLFVGNYIRTEDGGDAVLFEIYGRNTLGVIINETGEEKPFQKFSTGDRIWFKIPCVPLPEDEEILTLHVYDAARDYSAKPFRSEIPAEYLEKLAALDAAEQLLN